MTGVKKWLKVTVWIFFKVGLFVFPDGVSVRTGGSIVTLYLLIFIF